MKSLWLKAFVKSWSWVILTTVFGLLQLWLTLGSNLLVRTFNISYEKIFFDGVLLFFVTAVVSALVTDYYLSNLFYPRWATGILFGFFPSIIIVVSVWLFGICIGKEIQDIDLQVIKGLEYAVLFITLIYAVLFMTLIYTVIVKFLEFSYEEPKKEETEKG